MDSVTQPLAEAFQAIGDTLGPTLQSLSDAFGSLFKALGSQVMLLIGAFIPLDGTIDETTATIIGVKIALTPVVAAFQLIEQVANLLAAGFKGLQLAVLYARRGLSALNPFADSEKQLALDEEIGFVERELHEINGRFGKALDRHMKWYETNPAAQKPGAYTPVPANLPKVSGLKPTTGEMDWYKQQMKIATTPPPAKIPSNLPKVSGLTPTTGEMDWYRKQMEATKATSKPPATKTSAEIQQTAKNTFQLNQKASAQVKETSSVVSSTKGTTQAVNNLTAKITSQSSMQTTLASIYGLLASGAMRVIASLSNLPPGFGGNGILPPGTPPPNTTNPKKPFSFPGIGKAYNGHLGDAISSEMKHKPPGSDLVVANTSETIIPAAGGYGMKDFVRAIDDLSGAVAQVKYGGGKKPGGGSANWMQILEQDYLKNLNKPIPGGPVRGSGRGGLDTWEGPQASYVSPQSLQAASNRGVSAGGPINITAPITIHQQPGQSADELASIVALKIGEAVADARRSLLA
jgi:hypothetical protein